jgi:SWIM zinc finger.
MRTLPLADTEGRARRARGEPMAVRSFGTNLFEVRTEGGSYLVDVGAGRCTCPDFLFRDAQCKHLRRVAIEITERRVPPPGHVAVDCRDCGREVFARTDRAEGPHYCDDHRLVVGDTVRDRETGRRLVVVAGPDGRADAVHLAEATVADHPTNEGYDPTDAVVGAVYPGGQITDDGPRPRDLRVYAFPRSRLRAVDSAPER